MDVDGDDEDAEFGALALGGFDDDDSDVSNPDWEQDDDSDAGEPAAASLQKPPSKARNGAKNGRHKSAATHATAQSRPDGSDDDSTDDDDEDDDAARDEMDMDALDPALFGEAGASQPRRPLIEGDEEDFEPESFHRLVSSLQDTSREAGALRQQWDTSIEAENAEFENELRAAAGFKQKRRVRRKAHEQPLSAEVQALMAESTWHTLRTACTTRFPSSKK